MAPPERPARRPNPNAEAPRRVYVAPFAGERPDDYTVGWAPGRVELHGTPALSNTTGGVTDGITWEPWGGTQTGRQEHGDLHPVRQRRCMEELLCGGCGEQPDRHPTWGLLWVLSIHDLPTRWPCDIHTTSPPFCEPCALLAIRECRELREGFARVRAATSEIVGVSGTVYLPGREPKDRVVLLNDGAIRYVVARHLVRRLNGVRLDLQPAGAPPDARIATANARS